ncbi:MAG: citrate lyase ACP [Gemmatimonadota bacterium]|nr:MAG: citrate lyase ACP [Gemmatimonadota bacterium]
MSGGAGHGAAGPTGDDVRSDLRVEIELADKGGVRIELESKVASLYGDSIRDTAQAVLAALGVEHARVAIDDKGGLPFTIAARVEAAARRAGAKGKGDARPERMVARQGPTKRDRLRRSRLYLPGNQPKLMINAGLHHPDGIILDLEDSVHPDEKDTARLIVRNALRSVDFAGAERMVRINQLPLGFEDLKAIVPEGPDLILIPKVEEAGQVEEVDERIRGVRAKDGDGHPIWLMPILESALGIENAFAVARAAETVVALTIGLEDYTADLGVVKTKEGDESLYARTRLVNAARGAGIQAIDSVYGDVGDTEGLTAWARRSRALGFEGMGCIHPRQIQPIHDAFAPSSEEIEKALRIVSAFDEAQAAGLGVVRLGTKMIDPPVVLRAQRLVKNARRMGLIAEEES